MAIYASGQQIASNPAQLAQGVPTQILLDGYTFGAQAGVDLTVGKACFYSLTDQNVVFALGTSNGPFAGIVRRSNASAMSFGESPLGYSITVPAGQEVSVVTRGSITVLIGAFVSGGSAPVRGDVIYTATSTGALVSVAPGSSAPGGTVVTNFRVGQVPSGWTLGTLLEITNTQNVGA
jgi:hypothetical protein